MKTHCRLPVALLFVIFCQASFAQSPHVNPKQTIQQPPTSKQYTDNNQNATNQSTSIKNGKTDHTQDKSDQNSNIDTNKGQNKWPRSDIIAVGAGVSAFLQFLALCVTIRIMIRTAQRQLRAYVLPDKGSLFDGTMSNPPQPVYANVPGAVLTIRNTGQTPAYKVVSWARIDVAPINEPRLYKPQLSQVFSTTLGTGGTMPKQLWFDRPLTQEELTRVLEGTYAIYLHGRIEYRDVFKKKRFTNFRLHYSGQFPLLQGMVFNFSEQGNDAK